MGTAERRSAILKLLCRRRHETITNLASEFGVSERTIRRDIEVLSLSEPIYTQSGRYHGGVYVTENYYMDKMYFFDSQTAVLEKVLHYAENLNHTFLTPEEIEILRKILTDYKKPSAEMRK